MTTGQHTAITVADSDSGDGYRFVEFGAASFSALSADYSVPADGLWINVRNPALSFHASLTSVVPVTGTNAPTGFQTGINSYSCGI